MALAMPDEIKLECPVKSYRNFYRHNKVKFAEWKYSQKPKWM
jgi:hypothetical protein